MRKVTDKSEFVVGKYYWCRKNNRFFPPGKPVIAKCHDEDGKKYLSTNKWWEDQVLCKYTVYGPVPLPPQFDA